MTRIPTAEEYEKQIRYTKEELDERLTSMGREIDRHHPDGVILLVYLRAAAVFGADLLRKITVPADIDFLSIGRFQMDEKETLFYSCARTPRSASIDATFFCAPISCAAVSPCIFCFSN